MKHAAMILAGIAYFLVGLLQITATASGIQHLTGMWWMLCWFGAIFMGWTPLIGTGFGIYGAHKEWHWDLLPAIGLFAGIPLFFAAIAGIATAIEGRRT